MASKPPGEWGNAQWSQNAWWYDTGPAKPPGVWGVHKWGQATWWEPSPPPAGAGGWGDDWRFWYQVGNTVTHELTPLVVEAKWTTDSYTMGDGTFRGDCQPGKLTLRLWDPGRYMDELDPLGAVWATYRPYGYTWAWFYDSVTRGLYESGPSSDTRPAEPAADCVYTGVTWAYRLTAPTTSPRGAESVHARLVWVADTVNARAAALKLPTVTKDLDGQSQAVAALVADSTTGYYESVLQIVRDAAVYGWGGLKAVAGPGPTDPGTLALTYRRWENTVDRVLDQGQILAGPPVSVAADLVVNGWTWKGTDATLATEADVAVANPTNSAQIWGVQAKTPRAWDVTVAAVATALRATATALMAARNNPPAAGYLSTVSSQSGDRWTADGRPSAIPWDPRAHVWAPNDVADYIPTGSAAHVYYRVVSSDHDLTAKGWATVHALETFHPGTALPA